MAKALSIQPGLEPFPGYKVLHFLGKRGWGEVWRASRADGATFALKFIQAETGCAGPYEVRALNAIKKLSHPYLLQMHDVWVCPGHIVVCMELAEGNLIDLHDLYCKESGEAIPAEHLCHYLRQAAEAIDFLNERKHVVEGQRVGFRHLDIKPSNLLVVNGDVKLSDFSLAFKTGSRSGPHARAGTIQYAAPEIFQGFVSERSDQFSLAVSYYQLRTSKFPYPSPPQVFTSTYVRPAPDLSGVTPGERRVLNRALATIWQERFVTCVELIDRLAECVQAAKAVADASRAPTPPAAAPLAAPETAQARNTPTDDRPVPEEVRCSAAS